MQRQFNKLRKDYPDFVYEKYEICEINNTLKISFQFDILNLEKFCPTWHIPIKKLKSIEKLNKIKGLKNNNSVPYTSSPAVHALAFSLGMVELISYWKIACCPNVKINAGYIDFSQIEWWKKLYYNGLGEFFYVNGIKADIDSFMNITCGDNANANGIRDNKDNKTDTDITGIGSNLQGILIPIGGGKDSAVTIEILKDLQETNNCYFINGRTPCFDTAVIAGYPQEQMITAKRTLDGKMLDLNKRGFLNGHTPFSAIVAFSSVLTALLAGNKYVALSNESSANESTIKDSSVNHQYSKSYEFEVDFNNYLQRYISCGITYFSLLRPLSEIQIASMFSGYKQYHGIFKSCNKGSKTDIWCCDCSKCLFVCFILSPFLSTKELTAIFHKNLLDNERLVPVMEQLTGIQEDKPFECVGSRDEVNTAIVLSIEKITKSGENMPLLLRKYIELNTKDYEVYKSRPNPYIGYYNAEHLIPKQFEEILRHKIKEDMQWGN